MVAEHWRNRVSIVEGDITRLALDAIVNAANESLLAGGGVDGAIHRAAGPELQAACRMIGRCPTGEARITDGFGLPAKFVIHTVGPVWQGGGSGEDAALASCYRQALELASRHGIRTIAFPAISTGVFGFPADQAAQVAVAAVRAYLGDRGLPEEVIFCCFSTEAAAAHHAALAKAVAAADDGSAIVTPPHA